MNNKKKYVAVLSSTALSALILSAVVPNTAYAKTTGFLTKDTTGKYFEYNSTELLNSAEQSAEGFDAPLFEDYLTKQLVAFNDSVNGYVNDSAVEAAATTAAMNGTQFDLDNYTEKQATSTDILTNVKDVEQLTVKDGKVTPVDPSQTVKSVSAITVSDTTVGTVPTLPTTVNVTLGDGTTKTTNITWNAAATTASTYANAGKVTINGTLADYNNYPVSATVNVNSAGFDVDTISSITNLKTFAVNFSKPVDDTTATSSTIKVYKNGSTTAESTTIKVASDKKSATVIMGTKLQQGDVLEVVVDGVKTPAPEAQAITKYDQKQAAANDNTAPSFVSLNASTAKNIDITFSEPIDVAGASQVWNNFYIDGIKTYATLTNSPESNKLSLELPANLSAGSHTFKITGLRDYAGFLCQDATGSFNVSVDTTAPSVASVSATTKNKVRVVFSEPLSDIGTVKIGNHTTSFTQSDVVTTTPATVAFGSKGVIKVPDDSTGCTYDFYLPTGDYLTADDVLSSKLNYKGTTDVAGNKVDTTKGIDFAFTATNDTVAPTVTSTVVSADSTDGTSWKKNDVKLVFSKDIDQTAAINTANYVLKEINADGTKTVVAIPTPTVMDSKTVKIPLSGIASIAAGGNYTLEYNPTSATATGFIKDVSVRANDLANKVDNLVFNDVQAPTIGSVTLLQNAVASPSTPAKIRIVFSEAMDTASVTNLGNYIIGGKTLDQLAGTTAAVASDAKSVDITIPQDVCPTISTVAPATTITVLNIKDAAGNLTSDFNTPENITALASFNASGSTLQVTGKRTLTWKLAANTTSFAAIDPNELTVKNSSTDTVISGLQVTSAQLSDNGTTVTLTLNQDLNGDGTYDIPPVAPATTPTPVNITLGTVVAPATVSNTKDVNGATLSLAGFTTPAADAVAPTLTNAAVTVGGTDLPVTMSADGKTGTIDLSNATGNITALKVTASESGTLKLLSPDTTLFSSGSTQPVSTTATNITGGSATLANLQTLAKEDGDGDDNTLTITGSLVDGATPTTNKSAVVLKIKVK